MTQPQILNLPAVYEGTTWEGISSITIQRPAGSPLSLVGAQLTMTWRRVGERTERLRLSVGAGIQITNPSGGVCKIQSQILPLAAGSYNWEIIVILADGVTLPVFAGTQSINRIGVMS